MFRFVFAWTPSDAWGPVMAGEGFVGVESYTQPPTEIPWVGRRWTSLSGVTATEAGYAVIPAEERVPEAAGRGLRDAAAGVAGTVLVENGRGYQTSMQLWSLMEAARHPRVKIALDLDTARRAGETAGVLVPTVNLRIGLLRVRQNHADMTAYARRLAGIGFEGWVVCDPPTGGDRIAAARELASTFRGIFPARPVRKAVVAKAGA